MDSESDQHQPPAILVVACSSPNIGLAAEVVESRRVVNEEIGRCLTQDVEQTSLRRQRSWSPFPTVEAMGHRRYEMQPLASSMAKHDSEDGIAAADLTTANPTTREDTLEVPPRPITQPKRFSLMRQRLRFCVRETPAMSRGEQVRFLRRFRFGDTYKLKTRNWLIPQFLSGALTLMGVVLTLVGIISLQINKYLHVCDADDGIDCKSNTAKINNVMMPIGVGTTGGGLSLILISGFVFVHAFCVIYEDTDCEEDGIHDGVLHIPTSTRAALLESNAAILPEDIARCQSYYDNLQGYAAN